MKIHQLVAGFRRNDAISNLALLLRGLLRDSGYESEIICEKNKTDSLERSNVLDLDEWTPTCTKDDTVILHLSIGCRANMVFSELPCRKIIIYHNITPAKYFERLNPSTAAALDLGRRQAAALAGVAEINLADSEYNRKELETMGYRNTGVLQLMTNFGDVAARDDSGFMSRFGDGITNILFVGRVAPNKRHDDILKVFHDFQHCVEPRSRLIIVGSYAGTEAYHTLLLGAVNTMELSNVIFTGPVSQAELNACYNTASAFLCMSEHEGFCVPLLEAMQHDVPVFAMASTAVPETMDGAGVLFRDRDYALIAETIGRVIHDPDLRAGVIFGQRNRMSRYLARDFAAEFRAACRL